MEDPRPVPVQALTAEEQKHQGFGQGTWGRRGKRRKRSGPGFAGSGRGRVRLGNVANFHLTSADFGVSSSVLRGDQEPEEEQ